MLIRKLTEEDLDSLWQLRLHALQESPEAFGSTYEEALARGKTSLLPRLRGENSAFYVGAFTDGALIGMVAFLREEGAKSEHIGLVLSMYVLPHWRGHGIAKSLLQELITQARQIPGLAQLHLAVVTSMAPARRLYLSLGFTVYGTTPRALKVGSQCWDEDLMVLPLQ